MSDKKDKIDELIVLMMVQNGNRKDTRDLPKRTAETLSTCNTLPSEQFQMLVPCQMAPGTPEQIR